MKTLQVTWLCMAAWLLGGCDRAEEPLVPGSARKHVSSVPAALAETNEGEEGPASAPRLAEPEKERITSAAASYVEAFLRQDVPGMWKMQTKAARARLGLDREPQDSQPEDLITVPEKELTVDPLLAAIYEGVTYEVRQSTIHGSTAEVIVRSSPLNLPESLQTAVTAQQIPEDQRCVQMTLRLRHESGRWRVYRETREQFGTRTTFDFEHPEKAAIEFSQRADTHDPSGPPRKHLSPPPAAAQKNQSQQTRHDPFPEATTVADFEKAWRKDFAIENRPAWEVLEQFAEAAGLQWRQRWYDRPRITAPISLSLHGCSVLEALEQACLQIDQHPQYPPPCYYPKWPQRLVMKDGSRPFPAQAAGPFVVYVSEFRTYAGKTVGRLQVSCYGVDLPSGVGYHEKRLVVHAVRDATGTDVRDKNNRGPISVDLPDRYAAEIDVPLKNLVRGSRSLTLRASLSVLVPTEIRPIAFDSLLPGARQSVGGVTITIDRVATAPIRNVGKTIQTEIGVACARSAPDAARRPRSRGGGPRASGPRLASAIRQVTFFCFDENGAQLPSAVGYRMGDGAEYHILRWFPMKRSRAETLRFVGQARSMRAFVTTAAKQVVYDINLKVPLPPTALLPEHIVPAKFPGHAAPVSVTFLGFVLKPIRTIEVEVVNYSDKAIRELDLKVIYRDAAGKKLQEGSAIHTDIRSRTRGQLSFLSKHAQARLELDNVPSRPDKATTAELVLKRVVFADATEWTTETAAVPVTGTSYQPALLRDIFASYSPDAFTLMVVARKRDDSPSRLTGT